MPYLFDTDAIAEVLRDKPAKAYLEWLGTVPREEQFTSAINVAELYKAAYRSSNPGSWLQRLDRHIIPSMTVLPYNVSIARRYGQVRAALEERGSMPDEADLQIAATALEYGLTLVTSRIEQLQVIDELLLDPILLQSRRPRALPKKP